MMKWIRIIAPLVALIVVLGASYAALGNGQASARQASASAVAPAAQPPTEVPTAVPGTTTATEQPAETQDGETQDGTADEAKDSANEAVDAAALAAKATVTVDQAKTTALAANPGATVVKAELGEENGAMVYSFELSTGVDVKIDAQQGNIVNTDQAGGDTNNGANDTEAPDAPNK